MIRKLYLCPILAAISLSSFAQTLQQVTDNGSTTTNGLFINGTSSNSVAVGNYLRLGPENVIQQSTSQDLNFFTYNGSVWTTPFFIKNNGNVGIGTTSPAALLHVAGDVQFGRVGGSDWQFQTPSSDLRIVGSTPGAHFSLIPSGSGNVGIGTTSPSAKFEVQGGSALVNQDVLAGLGAQVTVSNGYGNQNGAVRLNLNNGGAVSWIKGIVTGPNTNSGSALAFGVPSGTSDGTEAMRIASNGYLGIGTTSPDEKLTVNGKIHTLEVIVDPTVPTPDYVFKKDYALRPLKDVEAYIEKNSHLPEIPSAAEVKEKGIAVGEMNMLLLKKIEELTLYMIEVKKENDSLKARIKKIEAHKP